MKSKLLLIALTLVTFTSFATPPLEEGKAIFSSRCAACHNINKTLTGPALAGVDQRRSIDWIISFVHSSQSVIKNGDKEALALFEKFNKIPMPDHKDLSADNIKSIVEYIKSESKTESDKPPFSRPGKLRPNYIPLSITNYGFFLGYLLVVTLLIAGMVFAVHVKSMQRKTGVL
jgi:cytochrome c551/c552